jgi:hypothetical protein
VIFGQTKAYLEKTVILYKIGETKEKNLFRIQSFLALTSIVGQGYHFLRWVGSIPRLTGGGIAPRE